MGPPEPTKAVDLIYEFYYFRATGEKIEELEDRIGKNEAECRQGLAHLFCQYVSSNGYRSIEEVEELFGMDKPILTSIATDWNRPLGLPEVKTIIKGSPQEKLATAFEYGLRTVQYLAQATKLSPCEVQFYARQAGLEHRLQEQIDHNRNFCAAIQKAALSPNKEPDDLHLKVLDGLHKIHALYKEAETLAGQTQAYPILRDWVVSLNAGTYLTNQQLAARHNTYPAKVSGILREIGLVPLIILENA
ncbi:MAG: hypothetical protein ACQESG_07190 [Nanobdellota archaeon]